MNTPGYVVLWSGLGGYCPGEEEVEKDHNLSDRQTHTPHVHWFSGHHGSKNLPKAVMETQISREQGEGGKFWIGDCPARAPFLLSTVGQGHKLFPKSTFTFSWNSAYFQSSVGLLIHPDHLLGCDPNNSFLILLINWTWQHSWIRWAWERKDFLIAKRII